MLDGQKPGGGVLEAEVPEESTYGAPNVGEILYRLRTQRRLSLREVAEASDLSPSFLSAVERGESDIAFGRLARLAAFFGHDIGSLLGYSERRAQPQWVKPEDRLLIDRGEGVRYEVLRLPGLAMELFVIDYEPGAGLRDDIAHEGVDVTYVLRGEVTLTLDGMDYLVRERECVVHSGAYNHRARNDSDKPASLVCVTTGSLY
jgi:transcriptional regulator with XRE-family HTH domain